MSDGASMAEAMAELAQSIRATPNNRRRLKSGTFWERLGCMRRTPERIQQVRELLEHHRVSVNLLQRRSMDELRDVAFGSEDKSDWIVLTHQESVSTQSASPESPAQPASGTTPLDSWFEKMTQLSLRSESDVVQKFISQLFDQLGYEEPDFTSGYTVWMHFGQQQLKGAVDAVLFKRDNHVKDDYNPENTLVLVEAKKIGKPIDGDVAGQANSYAMRLSPVYYVLTNGNDVEVYLYRMTIAKDECVMSFKRADLKRVWLELYKLLCKKRVLAIKEKRRQIIAELNESCVLTVKVVCKLPAVGSASQPSTNAVAP